MHENWFLNDQQFLALNSNLIKQNLVKVKFSMSTIEK